MKNKIILFLITGFIIYSCSEKTDLRLDSSYQRLVVEGAMTDEDKVQSVRLTLSADYLANKPPDLVTGAMVHIIETNPADNSEKIIPLDEEFPGVYNTTGKFRGITGRKYKLVIQNIQIGGGTFNFESTTEFLGKAPVIDSVILHQSQSSERWSIRVNFKDNSATHDYYMFNYSRNGVPQTDTIYDIAYTDDELFNGQYLYDLRVHRHIENWVEGDTITEYLSLIPERYYHFLLAAMAEAEPDVPIFAGPPANIPGNINNGALGFFNVYSVSHASAIVKIK